MKSKKTVGFRILIASSIMLLLFLIAGQSYSIINYEWTVSMGLQESVDEITLLGIAWIKAFAWADTLAYIPLLIAGILGLILGKNWGFFCLFASSAISVYWPIVNLLAIYIGRSEIDLNPDKYISYSILLPLVTCYGLWGMWYLIRNQTTLLKIRS